VSSSRQGFSLVEATISAGILGLVAAGITSVTFMTSRVAYSNIYENTAYTVAHAYGEQIKSISYAALKRALADPVAYDIPTESLMLGSDLASSDLKEADPLIFGVPVEKSIVVDIEEAGDGSLQERIMKMWFTVRGSEMTDTVDCWDAMEISIDFEWETFNGDTLVRHQGEVSLVRTNVSEY